MVLLGESPAAGATAAAAPSTLSASAARSSSWLRLRVAKSEPKAGIRQLPLTHLERVYAACGVEASVCAGGSVVKLLLLTLLLAG